MTGGRLRAGVVAVAVAALVAFVLAGWRPSELDPTAQPRTAAARAVDIDRAVEQVSHRVRSTPAGLAVDDPAYDASFGAAGFAVDDVQVGLTAVRRGTSSLSLTPRAWHGQSNQAVRQVAGGVSERVTARTGELEWDVVLAAPPPGRGDLVVEARTRGVIAAEPLGTDERGWRLRRDGGDPLRLGQVVVRDATGTELHRSLPRITGDTVTLHVPDAVLRAATYPLTVDPVIGPERPVSGPGRRPGYQSGAAAASAGSTSLVVWTDGIFDQSPDVYAARVDAAGHVLDPGAIPIAVAAGAQRSPAVTFDGTAFLVVWQDLRSGPGDIYGARVSTAGAVLSSTPIVISAATGEQSTPAVASSGSGSLVAWRDVRSGTADVYGARVNTSGSVLDASGIPISTAAGVQEDPAVTFDGTRFVVVWEDARSAARRDVYGARVTTAGAVLDTTGLGISTRFSRGGVDPAVASDGTNSLVVWESSDPPGYYAIEGARLSGAGIVLDPAPMVVSSSPDDDGHWDPAAAFLPGRGYLVAFTVSPGPFYELWTARVSSAGVVSPRVRIDPDPSSFQDDDAAPAVAAVAGADDWLVVWSRTPDVFLDSDVFGARVGAGGSVLDPRGFVVSTGSATQASPSVAFDGSTFLVVWEWAGGPGFGIDVLGARLSSTGDLLDPNGLDVARSDADQRAPAVVFDGTNFVVAFESHSLSGDPPTVRAVRVDRTGRSSDWLAPSGGGTDQRNPAITRTGSGTLVVWEALGASTRDVFASRIGTSGPPGAAFAVSTAAGTQASPAVAFDGSNSLVTWQDSRSGGFDIRAARVSPTAVLDSAGLAVSLAAGNQAAPSVAFDGSRYLVAWQDLRSGTTRDIFGSRVTTGGGVQDTAGIPVSTAGDNQTVPAVAANGTFLVVWQDRRSGTNQDVYGARVAGDGSVQDPSGLAIATAATDEQRPAVVKATSDDWLVVYDRADPPSKGNGIFARFVSAK